MTGLFAENAVIRRIAREPCMAGGGGAAILLQLAHPAVAAGVGAHTDFQRHPFRRLFGTVGWLTMTVYGPHRDAGEVSRRVRAMHRSVNGPGYDATTAELMVWVNATLVDTSLGLYGRFVGRLSDLEADAYLQDMKVMAAQLGCPVEAHPAGIAEFRSYMAEMTGSLQVTDEARKLAHQVLHPRFGLLVFPVMWLFRVVTAGLLPPRLREEFGLPWNGRRAYVFRVFMDAAMVGYKLVPRRLRGIGVPFVLWNTRRAFTKTGAPHRSAGLP